MELLSYLVEHGAGAIWDSKERPPDPKAWRIRQLMEHLSERHRRLLEQRYFLSESLDEIAKKEGCTKQAIVGALKRAEKNLVFIIAQHGDEVREVPEGET